MSAKGGSRSQIADIARQARELLGQVRESRWPGFQPAALAAPSTATADARKASTSSCTATPRAAAARQRPAPRTVTPAAVRTSTATVPAATPLRAEPSPWRSLEEIAQVVRSCTKCPLHATRSQAVPGEGDAQARLMFVGEAPGADEDRLGRPFVGPAGQLLDKMIGAMGLARGQVFIANTLKCRPPGNRDPLEHEVAACLPYLRAQIALIRPEIICSLGRHATHALLERKDALGALRGRFFDYRGRQLMPTFHPSYLLRTPEDKPVVWKDLRQIMQRLGLPLPEQNSTEESRR